MKVVVLAGTCDWGECPLALASPRSLVPIANRPLVAHILTALKEAGATEVAICANGDGDKLQRVLGEGADLGMRLHYVEDKMPRGPAGCVRDAMAFIGHDECIAIEGALLPHIDIRRMVTAHRRSGAALTIGVDESVAPGRWREGTSPQILGVYAFSASALSQIPEKGYQDIKEGLVAKLHRSGQHVEACCLKGQAPRVTGPESYLAVNGWALEQLAAGRVALPGYRQVGEAFIHMTATVASTTRLAGAVMIGPRTVVRDEAILIGPTSIGAGCDVGVGSMVYFSTIWDGVTIGTRSRIDESILACGAAVLPESEVTETVRLPKLERSPCRGGGRAVMKRFLATLQSWV